MGVMPVLPRFPDLRPSTMTIDSNEPKPKPEPEPRVIVLCFDGTGNRFDDTVGHPLTFSRGDHANKRELQNTNIAKFHGLLKKSCPLDQIVYYQVRLALLPSRLNFRSYPERARRAPQPGVGTYVNAGIVSPWLTQFAKWSDTSGKCRVIFMQF